SSDLCLSAPDGRASGRSHHLRGVFNVHPMAKGSRTSGAAALEVGAPSVGANAAGRMTGIDAARGIAMVFVCVSHVRYHFHDSVPALYSLLTNVTRLDRKSTRLNSSHVKI